MQETIVKGQIEELIKELSFQVQLKEDSHIISLTSNELADVLVKISGFARKDFTLDQLLENTLAVLGEVGIAERVLLFQINNDESKYSLTHHWSSPYLPKFDPIGFQLDLKDFPLFNLFKLHENHTFQIQEFSKYLSLPHYIFRNKFKALFIKLKTKSLLVTTGSSDKVKLSMNLQFCTRDVVWSNEIEKLLQSVVDQLAVAVEQFAEKKKREGLQENVIYLQEKAIKEQEEILRQFASDIHDLPCSVIPNLRQAIKNRDFSECERLADELHNNLRILINEYIIPDINLLGFVGTVYQFINGFKKAFRGKVKVELPNEEINLSQKKAIELYKVIKEWFCNIEKHSKATEVTFDLKKLNDCS